MGGEQEGHHPLGQEGAFQEHFLVTRELLGKADVEIYEEVTFALGVLEQRHPLPGHHFTVLGAAKQRKRLRGAAG